MDDILEALQKAKVIPAAMVKEIRSQQRQSAQSNTSRPVTRKKMLSRLTDLEVATDVGSFRELAREILLVDVMEIHEVVRLAQHFSGKPGGKRLIATIKRLSDNLASAKRTDHNRLITGVLQLDDRGG